jgi:hypothetical protein
MRYTKQGPDLVIRNPMNRLGVIIESEVGHNITEQSYTKPEREDRRSGEMKIKAIIVITKTPRRVWQKRLESIISEDIKQADSESQKASILRRSFRI